MEDEKKLIDAETRYWEKEYCWAVQRGYRVRREKAEAILKDLLWARNRRFNQSRKEG